jgi:folate-binding protein YgfZ
LGFLVTGHDSFWFKMRVSIIYSIKRDQKANMVKLTHLSAIRFGGADAGDFLHNQLSSDVLGLASGDSVFACYCEPKGRVLALMLVYKAKEDFVIIMSNSLVTGISNRLKIYRMRSSVSIDILDDYTISGVIADDASETPLPETQAVRLPGSDLWLVLDSPNMNADTDITSQREWKISELRLGVTWLQPETSGQFLPQMLGFEELGAVNYKKGCYPGQEIVARTHYLGKVKRHPRLINCQLKAVPKPMDKISIHGNDQAHDAIVVDNGLGMEGDICLLTITRMSPDLTAKMVEFEGETSMVF